MEFNETTAIYLQIAAYVCDQVQLGAWPPGSKVPSVRELAIQLEVNPNTVMRAYELLQAQGVIFTKRGMGFFVHQDAPEVVLRARKKQFIETELPALFRKMHMNGISKEELDREYHHFLNTLSQ